MKNSNIQWIGEIPDDWEVLKNKYNFELSKEIVGAKSASTQLLSLTKNGIKAITEDQQNGKVPASFNTYQVVKKDDIVMCLFDLDVSAVFSGISNYDGMISPAYKCFKCKPHLNPKYVDYYFRSVFVDRKYKRYSKNVRYSISAEEFMTLPILVPPLATQTSIATYLDAKCSEIHGLIADINKQIETLNELKKSTITEAVTKGLNKNVKLKDGGIQWIGMIPEGWRVTKLKYLGKFINGYAFDSKLFCNDGVQVVKISNIQPGYLSLEDKSYVSTVYYKQLTQYRVEKNDIVFALTRPVINGGIKTAIVYENCKLLLNQRTAMFKGNNKMLSKWLFYLMQCNYFVFEFINLIDFTGLQPNISTNDISNIDVPYISIEEQRDIATYLDTKCTEFDSIISDKQKQISTLEAYKKSLIYEYVTGKKEVES